MNKFEKARFHVDLVEAASTAAIDVVWNKLRYDTEYFDCADDETPEWFNDEWLKAHVNAAGCEYLQMAKEFTYQLEKSL